MVRTGSQGRVDLVRKKAATSESSPVPKITVDVGDDDGDLLAMKRILCADDIELWMRVWEVFSKPARV